MIINGSGISPYSGAIRGSGSIIKDGPAIQFLNGENTYTGRTTVNGGTLILASGTSTSYTANNGSTLTLAFGDFGFSSLNANPGGIIHYNYPVIIGGFFHGAGNHDISGVTSFNGTTFGPGVVLTLSTPTLNNVTNSGTLTLNGVTWSGGYNTAAGSITIGGSLTVSEFENTGSITVTRRSSLISNGTNLVSGAGGRINVNTQGAIVLNAGSLDLYGSLLINNGTIDGTTNVNYGALAKGAGRYGDVNVTDGGRFSPGNSPGSVTTGSTTWNSGGGYLVEIADALAGSGIGWDRWNINGALHLNATSGTNGRFTISLSTLDALAANFDNTHDYTWPILHASDGIIGFDASELTLDTLGFKNNLGGGHFTIENSNSDLVVHFSAVPEPAVMGLVAAAAGVARRRRR
jgi:autotransporter-associated beta strand protein